MQNHNVKWDLGSFRDPVGSVFFTNDEVYRSLSDSSVPIMQELINLKFFQDYIENNKIISSELVANTFADVPSSYILKHQKINFINYPYEWSFNMLKDAALLTLSILKNCLKHGFILKDGSAWNLTFFNGRMVFFDVLSIDKYKDGQTWEGYQQFCSEFLYPLLVFAYKGVDFQQFFRGCLTGMDVDLTYNFFNLKDSFKPGVFKHVFLNKALNSNKSVSSATLKDKIKLPKTALVAIVDKLIKVVNSIQSKKLDSTWIDYTKNNTYEKQDDLAKKEYIDQFCASSGSDTNNSTIIDLGCNTGQYSIIASKHQNTISADIDSLCIDFLYKKITSESITNITPVTLNLMNPSADFGWDLSERNSIFKRLNTNLENGSFLALALIHHICIANNVPIERFIQLLHKVAKRGILEWVDKEDPMVQFLLRNRTDIFDNYNWDTFENIVKKYFIIKDVKIINNNCRRLCWLESLN